MAKQKVFNLSLRNLTYRLRKFRDILDEELSKIIEENADVITSMISENQLYELGETGKKVPIASYAPYAPRTIKKKIRKGQPYDRVTLKDTGKFYESFIVVTTHDGFSIQAKDFKAKYLIPKYGETILRLSDENLKILLHEYIRPKLVQRLKERLINED